MLPTKPTFPAVNRAKAVGIIAILLGSFSAMFNMAIWYIGQDIYYIYEVVESPATPWAVLGFFFVQAASILLIVLGLRYLRKGFFKSRPDEQGQPTLNAIIAGVLDSQKDIRIGIIVGITYAVFYSFVSAILVYQPGVDFSQAYDVTGPSWRAEACCGNFGTIPIVIGYLPQFHFGVRILPLDMLFVAVIPILVGLNAAVASNAMRNRPMGSSGTWLGAIGGSIGLFTACPTCAGFFLASAIGGFGAVTLAATLASLQTLFVAITIPVLLLNPLLIASRLRRALYGSCEIPT